ncbi:beta-ketoacyl synthase chain length factor [Chitinophaga silvatica]|nr:beta-ketoacyl synthase chain length factor [Chitinophaga silvatica]
MAAISPQPTFEENLFSAQLLYTDNNLLPCKEPDYKPFIPANSLRRMSRMLKIGLTTALKAITDSNLTVQGPIVTGTGKGSLQDTEKFLKEIVTYQETALNPTPFIQSTYNSVNGLIALQQKCTAYNNTFVHRGFSFENALLDSMMLLQEGSDHVLTGAFEEITAEHFYIKSRIGFWKSEQIDSRELLLHNTPGSVAGEGAAFFMLTQEPTDQSYAAINGLKLLYKPSAEKVLSTLQAFAPEVDAVITGRNGDCRFNHFYNIVEQHFDNIPHIPFKHLCGEYDTASAFGMWLGANLLKHQELPEAWFAKDQHPSKPINKILLYNHFYGEQHAFILLERV